MIWRIAAAISPRSAICGVYPRVRGASSFARSVRDAHALQPKLQSLRHCLEDHAVQSAPTLAGAAREYSVALAHDYLNQFGGAERVLLELSRTWPNAPIYTSLYRPTSTFPEFAAKDIRRSPLDRLPVDKGFRALAPLYPAAFRSLGVLDYDVVISSSSGWAHGLRTTGDSLHLVYCHTPARWLYGSREHLRGSIGPLLLAPLRPMLRRWDRAAARRADLYVTTNRGVRERIETIYGRRAHIVHPPVDIRRFRPATRGDRLLVVSRLLPYKRVDLVVRAATKVGIGLDVVGEGPSLPYLQTLAGPSVAFHGRVQDETVVKLLEGCRALCIAATEDFGLTPLEANAAGKPVIAYASGGVLETMNEGVTAAFFDQLTVDAFLDAVRRADQIEAAPTQLRDSAKRFSADSFRRQMRYLTERALINYRGDRQHGDQDDWPPGT